ncbi:YncE family protein [Polyangium spumosum]|uniref:YncE family protein n=1 Tax=Polyangium spumosum TaxID=889282 RepID=A0A6N7PL39_9BACT|nr:YncE family protein [Polyangium spumosum]MRG92738.1 YncE family protein [Polyangium spumosum]
MITTHLRALAGAALLAVLPACGEAPIEYRYDPFAGDAFPDRREPVAVPPGGLGIVTDSLSDTLSLIDLGTGEKIRRVPVGRDPVGLDGPHHVTVDPAGRFVYIGLSYPIVATGGPHASHGASIQPGYVQKLSLDDFRILGQVRVDANPGEIVASDDGRRVVVSHFDLQRALKNPGNLDRARATIALVDPAAVLPTGSTDPARITTCIAPHGMALSRPDGARAYVACYGEDVVAVVDLDKREVLDRIPVDPSGGSIGDPQYGPYSAILSPDGKTLALGNTVSKDVRFFDVEANAMDPARTIDTLGAPFFPAFSPDAKYLWIPMQSPDALVLWDLEAGQEVTRRDFTADECKWPHVVERLDDTRIALVCEGDHVATGKVLLLDAMTLETKNEAIVGVYPDALARIPGPGL